MNKNKVYLVKIMLISERVIVRWGPNGIDDH